MKSAVPIYKKQLNRSFGDDLNNAVMSNNSMNLKYTSAARNFFKNTFCGRLEIFMALNIKRPNGTEDVIPKNINKWHTVENIAKDVASMYGFKEIRIPTFEKILNYFSVP